MYRCTHQFAPNNQSVGMNEGKTRSELGDRSEQRQPPGEIVVVVNYGIVALCIVQAFCGREVGVKFEFLLQITPTIHFEPGGHWSFKKIIIHQCEQLLNKPHVIVLI